MGKKNYLVADSFAAGAVAGGGARVGGFAETLERASHG